MAALAVVFLLGTAAHPGAATLKERFRNAKEKTKEAFGSKSSGDFVVFTIPFRGDEVVVKLPGDGDAAYREAVSVIKNAGDVPAAENSLKTVVQNQPAFAAGWLALGVAQEIRGALKDALNSYIKADADKNEKVKEEAASGIARVKALARYKGITL